MRRTSPHEKFHDPIMFFGKHLPLDAVIMYDTCGDLHTNRDISNLFCILDLGTIRCKHPPKEVQWAP